MPRQPGLWKRKQDGFWYTTIRGRKLRLAADKSEARKALYELLAQPDAGPTDTRRLTFRKLADRFLDHCKRTMAESTFKGRNYYLQSFCDHIGRRAVADLRVEHVTAWEVKNAHWAQSTVATVRSILIACLNWGEEQGIIPANPIPKLKTVAYTRRERILTYDERERIKTVVTPAFRAFLTALELTGARPFAEVAALTAAMVDWADGTITFEKHKNAKKGKRRTIYITPQLAALLRRQIAAHPAGPLFLTGRGNRWTAPRVTWWIRELEKRLKIPRLTLYAYRHSFCTDALEKGLTADVVAELVGNSAATVARHYSHLEQKKNALKAAAARAVS